MGRRRTPAADRVATAGALILGVIMPATCSTRAPLAQVDENSLGHWLGHHLQQLFDDPGTPELHHGGGWTGTSSAGPR